MGGLNIKVIIGAIIITILLSGTFYIQKLRSDLKLAAEIQAKLETVINRQKLVIEQTQKDIERMNDIQKVLQEEKNTADQEVSILRKKFDEFNKAITKKPGLVETRINKATKDALRCNELVSGAKLTELEKSGKVKNNICPELLGGVK